MLGDITTVGVGSNTIVSQFNIKKCWFGVKT